MDITDHNFSGLEGNKSVNGETDPNKDTTPSNQPEKRKSTIENPENSEMKTKRGRKKGGKIIPLEVDKTRYSLRSSADGGSILRSTSNGESESQNSDINSDNESVAGTSSQIEPVSGTKKRGRKPRSSSDKLYTIRNRVRSLNDQNAHGDNYDLGALGKTRAMFHDGGSSSTPSCSSQSYSFVPATPRLRQEDIDAISSQVLSSIMSQLTSTITEQITLAFRVAQRGSSSHHTSIPDPKNDEEHDDDDDGDDGEEH